jgi:hypothetical protein
MMLSSRTRLYVTPLHTLEIIPCLNGKLIDNVVIYFLLDDDLGGILAEASQLSCGDETKGGMMIMSRKYHPHLSRGWVLLL